MKAKQDEQTLEDLRNILTEFWLGVMENIKADFPDRVKVSELLAKYILEAGASPIKRKQARRPSTVEILQLAKKLEQAKGTPLPPDFGDII